MTQSAGPQPGVGSLYVVATPIGHLADLSPRAAETLRTVALVAAEDTRVARVLLAHVGARPEVVSVHAHNEARRVEGLVGRLLAGTNVALTSDAGTPGISDPGIRLVAAAQAAGIRVVPIPGPCAVTAIISASGLGDGRFLFEGFLPARGSARRQRLQTLARQPVVVVLYESPHRILDLAQQLAECLEPDRPVVLGRELTKRFEQIHRGPVAGLSDWLKADPDHQRGEFVVALGPWDGPAPSEEAAPGVNLDSAAGQVPEAVPVAEVLRALASQMPLRQAARILAQATGARANVIYGLGLALRLAQSAESLEPSIAADSAINEAGDNHST